jgi:hypothetical protein
LLEKDFTIVILPFKYKSGFQNILMNFQFNFCEWKEFLTSKIVKRAFLILAIVLHSISLVNCSKSESKEPVDEQLCLEGTWGITALKYVLQGVTQDISDNEIKSGKVVNDLYFLKNGKFKQISDMSGSGTMFTYEGTWKITGTKLIITLLVDGMHSDVVYTCEQKSGLLFLTLIFPERSMSIVNTYRKK